MADVVFRDLCLDANRPEVVADFWAPLLRLTVEPLDEGDESIALRGDHNVWVCRVPEPQTVKNRVHLDVRFEDPYDVPGATVVREMDDGVHWRVLADPDGLQFCAFGPRDGASPGGYELVVDCVDARAVGQWWADRFGVELQVDDGDPWVSLEGVPGFPYQYWVFGPVPEPKTVKNRVHWDVNLADGSLAGLLEAGATVVRERDDEIRWTILADPEGNEFCVFGAD